MRDSFSHPETEVSSSCVPGGRAAVLFCSGLEVSVGALSVELVGAGAVVVGVFGAGVVGVELLAPIEAVAIEVVVVLRSVCVKVVMYLVSASALKMLVLARPVLWWSASV